MTFSNKIKRNQPSVKAGDKFDNNHSDDQVTVTMYGGYNNVTVEFSDGRQGFGSVQALKAGAITPIGEVK
jgi:hypothetical protein